MRTLLHKFDTSLAKSVQGLPTGVRPVMIFASIVGLPIVTLGVSALITLGGMFYGNRSFFFAGAAAMAALGIGTLLKLALRRKRPLTDYVLTMRIKSFSFPSGHSLGSVVSFGLLAHTGVLLLPLTVGYIFAATVVLLCFFIGVSRVYLGAHFPSDVVAGWLLGALALAVITGGIQPQL